MKNTLLMRLIFWMGELLMALPLSLKAAFLAYELSAQTTMQNIARIITGGAPADGGQVPITTYEPLWGILAGIICFALISFFWYLLCSAVKRILATK